MENAKSNQSLSPKYELGGQERNRRKNVNQNSCHQLFLNRASLRVQDQRRPQPNLRGHDQHGRLRFCACVQEKYSRNIQEIFKRNIRGHDQHGRLRFCACANVPEKYQRGHPNIP